ncbi:cold-shock protein [Paenibacillus sp.]|uniref:cold-shock protein n=1 Tax=Paenibacillus sp. TaxID=58172 RepID=UPI002D3018A8|nr:cold-shock protein [Paenibacillus sp.]HZG54858.1 cold-shock protein [Paenibacillus sp.]
MYYSRKRPMEDYPTESTAVWTCTKEGCKGWMRNEYSFADVPACAQCRSPMTLGMRNLPVLMDSTYDRKPAASKKPAVAEVAFGPAGS